MILVRLPARPEMLARVLPRSRPVTLDDLPLVTRVTHDLNAAHETAARLRQVGAVVVIVEEPIDPAGSAFCGNHPAQLAARDCSQCDNTICPGCMADAGGESLCRPCHTSQARGVLLTRRRQLFVLLIFVAFLYKVWDHLQDDVNQVQGSAPITIGIMQFAPKADVGATIIRQLNRGLTDTQTRPRLQDISEWFNAEHARYTTDRDRRFRVEVRGPFGVDIKPPSLSEAGDSWFTRMFRAYQYPKYFHQVARDNGLAVDTYTVKVYVVYGGSDIDMASHSRGSKTGRIAVVYVSLDETNPGYPLASMAHEIGHALGAADSYDPNTNHASHPWGYIEPFADPLFPQPYAELMAVDIPLSPTIEKEVSNLSEIRIGHRTAAQMGWIPPEQADLFYTPPALSPEDKLRPKTPQPEASEDSG